MKVFWNYWTRFWVLITVPFYFKRVKINHSKKIDWSKPIILAGNHQNAFLDPILIGEFAGKPTGFLTRSDVFNTTFKKNLLGLWNMLPIYRAQDGGDVVQKNEAIFKRTFKLLRSKVGMVIFPEANHKGQKMVRPIKKGVIRMAFGAYEEHPKNEEIQIVPVGVCYEKYSGYHTELTMNYGDPIAVKDFYPAYKENPGKAVTEFKVVVQKAMSDQVIDVKQKEAYEELLFAVNLKKAKAGKMPMSQVFGFEKAALKGFQDSGQFMEEEFRSKFTSLKNFCKRYSLEHWFPIGEKLSGGQQLALMLPLFFYHLGLLVHWPILKLVSMIEGAIKDPTWKGSILFGASMFLVPDYYLIMFFVGFFVTGSWLGALGVIGGLGLLGVLSRISRPAARKYYQFKAAKKAEEKDKKLFEEMVMLRKELLQLV